MADSGEEASSDLVDQSEHDMYIAQLKEVFDSCDQSGSQSLNRQELYILCEKLQLDDQSEYLVNELLRDKDEVDFEDFKGSFVQILCQTYANVPVSEDESEANKSGSQPDQDADEDAMGPAQPDNEDDEESEVSPRYVVGNKRYGRRSQPVSVEELDSLADDEEEMEEVMSSGSLKHSLVVAEATDSDEEVGESQKKRQRRHRHSSGGEAETFEAEGQLNLSMADSAQQQKEEESYLRGIWDSLGVGGNGFITIQELATVCTHIGMDEMNDMQLQQLFNKLDADGDGRVSFREFLEEMFQHQGPSSTQATPRSVGATPTRALSAQKKIKTLGPGGEERITPSIIQGSGVTGLFSALDPGKTGFAKPEAIVDFWEKYSISNGMDILMGLGFELDAKVNLLDLSAALEHELLGADETNMSLQAATVSYQQEMRTIKSSLEQAGWAKEKLKLDLAEANARNSLLAKEVDERHASMERSSESKLLTIEKKYQEQVRALQADLEAERESFTAATARQRQSADANMAALRKEEARLREQLSLAQKELDKLSGDLEETSGQLEESVRQSQRLQRELDGMENIHRKLSEFESAGILDPEEHTFAVEKIQRLEQDNKDLKDHNDELRAELEQTKHQATPSRRPLGPSPDLTEEHAQHTPIRKDGSIMSDYIKPFIKKKSPFSSADYSDDDAQLSVEKRQQRPLPTDDDDISLGSASDDESVEQLKAQFELERKGIEENCRLEIAAVEEKHDREKQEILQHLDQDKRHLEADFQRLQEEALAELARELQTNFAHEKEDLIEKHESEKNHLKQLLAEEKQELMDRVQVDGEHNLRSKVQDLKVRHKQEREELEEALDDTEARVQDLEDHKVKLEQQKGKLDQQKADLEEELVLLGEQRFVLEEENVEFKTRIQQLEEYLKTQREESEKEVLKQKTEMEGMLSRHLQNVSDVEGQKHDLEMMYKKQLSEMEMKHREEKLELSSLIEEYKQEIREVRKHLALVELELTQQRQEMEVNVKQEKQEIQQVYEDKVEELGTALEESEAKTGVELAKQREEMEVKFRHEKEEIQQAYEEKLKELQHVMGNTEAEIELELQQQREKMEVNFRHEKEEMQQAYEEKLKELQHVLGNRESEIDHDLQQQREKIEVNFRKEKEEMQKAHEDKLKELQHVMGNRESEIDHDLQQQRKKMEVNFRHEKEEMQRVYEDKLKELQHAIGNRESEIDVDIQQQKEEMIRIFEQEKREIQNMYEEKLAELQAAQDEKEARAERDLKQQRKAMEVNFDQEKQEIKNVYEEKLQELKALVDEREAHMANVFDGGADSLRGQMKEDFERLLQGRMEEAVRKERKAVTEGLSKKEQELEAEFDMKRSEISHVFEREKAELVERYEGQVAALRAELTHLQGKVEEEREALASRYEGEKQALEDQLAQQIKDELEDELCEQMEEIKEAYEDMRRGYEAEATLLREEIHDLQQNLDRETRNRRQLEDTRRENTRLLQEKTKAERAQQELEETLRETKAALEARIDELLAEKHGALTADKAGVVESSSHSGRDKANHEAVLLEKEELVEKLKQLDEQLVELQSKAGTVDRLQTKVDQLTWENTDLTSRLRSSQDRPSTHVPEHAQKAISELTHEKSVLEEQLADTESKLAEIEDMAKKYTHLQFDLGQLSIGQSALEETLHETQDKLADNEAQLFQAEKELKDARRYVDKYKLLQKKYEDVCKERDRLTTLVKTLKEQMNSSLQEDTADKKQLSAVLEEKKALESQLQKVSDKMLEATTNFTASQTQHIRELERWREQCSGMVELQKYTRLQIDLADNQRSLRDLQQLLSNKEEMTSNMFKETLESHEGTVAGLEDRKQSLESKLRALQKLLDQHVCKFKEQCDKAERRNLLVVDLYKENAGLMESLANVEEQKKDAVSRCYRLEDQCNELRRMLTKMANLAVS